MQIFESAMAGTMESGDIYIEIGPSEQQGLNITLKSSVSGQFGAQIRETIRKAAQDAGLENANIHAVDKGALDCTIRARVLTAALRAEGREAYAWRKEA